MAGNYEKFKAAGAEILAISVDPQNKSSELTEKLKLPFPVLLDTDHKVIDLYDILDPNGKISRASVFILDKKGIVQYAWVADDYKVRPPDDSLLAEVGKIK